VFLKYLIIELIFIPWQIIPFYFLFYWIIPKYNLGLSILKSCFYFIAALLVCVLSYRSMIKPINLQFYGDIPPFKLFELKRIIHTLREFLPPIALASTIKLFKTKIVNDKKNKELAAQKREMEIHLLKTNFNPHFLFNTLNNLYGLARKNENKSAEYTLKLAEIMRYLLNDAQADRVSIDKEIVLIEDYIQLEKLRYGDRLSVDFKYTIVDSFFISPMILITFIENAFKHGASEHSNESWIKISLTAQKQKLILSVANSINKPTNIEQGHGIRNARKQLELIYPQNHSLIVNQSHNEFNIKLTIIS
jgi:two-component system, LytTR family, sensor kinase